MAPRIRTQDLSPTKLRRQKEEKVPMVNRDRVYKQKNSGDLPVTRVISNKEEDYVARKGITPARKEITPATERPKRVMINNRRPSVARIETTEIPKGAPLLDVKKKKTDERFPTPKEINPATSCSKSFIHRGVQKQLDRNMASMVASHPERMVTSVIQTRSRLEALRFLKCAQMKRRARKKQSWDSLNLSTNLDETNATSKDYATVELNLLRDLSSCRLEIIMSNLKIGTLKSELSRIPKGDYAKHAKWHGVLRSAMGRRHGEVEWEKKRAEVIRNQMSRYNLVLQFHQLKSVWKETRNKKYASLMIEAAAKKSELLKEAATTKASKVPSGPVNWTAVQCTAWQDEPGVLN